MNFVKPDDLDLRCLGFIMATSYFPWNYNKRTKYPDPLQSDREQTPACQMSIQDGLLISFGERTASILLPVFPKRGSVLALHAKMRKCSKNFASPI